MIWSIIEGFIEVYNRFFMCSTDSVVTSEMRLISIKYNEMVFCDICTNLVIFEALRWMEVKAEEELVMLEDDNFVSFVLARNIVIFLSKPTEMSLQANHVAIKVFEEMEPELLVICKIPSTTAMLVAPSVFFPREINPFGMAEFIPHESQKTFSSKCKSDESNHLVKCHSSADNKSFWCVNAHFIINFSIEEPHGDSFITDKSLIMTFRVDNAFLIMSTIN